MKNADMPASPVIIPGGVVAQPHHGFTKREMLAAHIAAGNMAARNVPWVEVDVGFQAQIVVQMTDALLAELERTA